MIAAVHGMCAGAGQYFINQSDIIICSDDAVFFDPHANGGIASALEPIGLLHRGVPLGDVLLQNGLSYTHIGNSPEPGEPPARYDLGRDVEVR